VGRRDRLALRAAEMLLVGRYNHEMCRAIRYPERGRSLNVDPRTYSGFSLVELMIVLVVFGIVLGFGLPS